MEGEIRIVAISANGKQKEYTLPRPPRPQARGGLSKQNSKTRPPTLFTSIERGEMREYQRSAGY